MKKLLITPLCLYFGGFMLAQENSQIEQLDSVTVVTKVPIAEKNSGKVIAKITRETIENNKGKSVAQLINEVSGIEINGSRGNVGQNLGYFVRGGRNRQVVIMIDGVQLNDPSQIQNDYDLRLIPTSEIDHIEIIKGASSVLYGSGAATAVISISTKKVSEKTIAASFTSAVGTNSASEEDDSSRTLEEFTNAVSINGSLKKFFYRASFSNKYVNGLSAIAAPEGEARFEADVFNRFDGRINLGYRFSKNVSMSQFFSFDTFKAGFDNFDYTDAEHLSITRQRKTGGHFEWKYKKGIYVFNDNYSWIEREVVSSFPTKYDSKSYTLDNYIHHRFSEKISLLVGFNFNTSRFNSFTIPFGETDFAQDVYEDTAKFNTVDPYLNLTYISSFGLQLNAGARLNLHSVYNSHWVYNINPSYVFDIGKNTLKVLASYSTAYITPSLFQLYDPLYGNEALQPEENTTMEGGLEFMTENNFRISTVYFNRNEENFIDFVLLDPETYSYSYQNISETFEANGVEVEISKNFGEKLTASANYTNTQPDKRFALRIPEHKVNASIGYRPVASTFFGLSYQYNSERSDSYFNPTTFETETVILKSYGLLDATASSKVYHNVTVFATVSNILNEEYEELYRYQTLGRNFRAGFSLEF
ncbi:vitamin B12 transporter [Ulvibacter sp. MAR_2010_11]|uniref:TonB-dependent receptor plug domain-containing protein n=1 Tax=Ulvibacter sp. MAR_2010_11 TaxID=1250229 RepID=UPI000C2CBAA3|nr:TonB-dependent receptor plug domain-containing protein [Ulvibacter sp. MAR_2010_11]PKA83945.1 vitamin B12 transporter [Ulvibacter sp. MAR_2010_11]